MNYLSCLSIKAEQLLRLCGSAGHLVEGPVLDGSIQHLDNGVCGAVVVDWTLGSSWPDLQHIGDSGRLASTGADGDSQITLPLKSLVKLTPRSIDAESKTTRTDIKMFMYLIICSH